MTFTAVRVLGWAVLQKLSILTETGASLRPPNSPRSNQAVKSEGAKHQEKRGTQVRTLKRLHYDVILFYPIRREQNYILHGAGNPRYHQKLEKKIFQFILKHFTSNV